MICGARRRRLCAMPAFLLHHEHEPRDCAVTFAAWLGFDSPLRRQRERLLDAGTRRGIAQIVGARQPFVDVDGLPGIDAPRHGRPNRRAIDPHVVRVGRVSV